MFDRKIYGDQQLWVNGLMVSGVQAVDGNYSLPVSNILSYGGGITQTFSDKLIGNISLEKLIVGHDIFYDLITTGNFTGHLNYDNGIFGFSQAYITNYTCSCAIGEVASSSANIIAYGNVGSGITTTTGNSDPFPIQTVGYYGIDLTLNDTHETNRVQSFEYIVNINRKPIYFIGNSVPNHVLIEWPIEIELSFVLDTDDYETRQLMQLACDERTGSLSISLKDCLGDTINTLYMPSGKIESESVNSSIADRLSSKLVYKGYLNSLEGF